MEEVAIVIPIYKTQMNRFETISFHQCRAILNRHKFILIAPEGLDLSKYQEANDQIIRFDPYYFKSLKHYNKLLLSDLFYKEFNGFEYILIYQLDAFVFSDQLTSWCKKKYDYIGAPWINDYFRIFIYMVLKINIKTSFKMLFNKNYWNSVGNGGLSLRRVPTFLGHFKDKNCFADKWTGNEDYYWTLFAKNSNKHFKLPKPKEAMQFSIELSPKYCMKKNSGRLPFGLHAWERYNIDFWKPYIKEAGYDL
jgi:hypothetical protein